MPRLTLDSFSEIEIGGTTWTTYPFCEERYVGPWGSVGGKVVCAIVCGSGFTFSDGTAIPGGSQNCWFHRGAPGADAVFRRKLVVEGRLYVRDDVGGGYLTARQNKLEFFWDSTGAKIGEVTFASLGWQSGEPYEGGLIVEASGTRQASHSVAGCGYAACSIPTRCRTFRPQRAGGASLALMDLWRVTSTHTSHYLGNDIDMTGVTRIVANTTNDGHCFAVALIP